MSYWPMYFYQYSLLGYDRSFIEPRAWKAALGLEQKFLFWASHGIFTKDFVLEMILIVISMLKKKKKIQVSFKALPHNYPWQNVILLTLCRHVMSCFNGKAWQDLLFGANAGGLSHCQGFVQNTWKNWGMSPCSCPPDKSFTFQQVPPSPTDVLSQYDRAGEDGQEKSATMFICTMPFSVQVGS